MLILFLKFVIVKTGNVVGFYPREVKNRASERLRGLHGAANPEP